MSHSLLRYLDTIDPFQDFQNSKKVSIIINLMNKHISYHSAENHGIEIEQIVSIPPKYQYSRGNSSEK